MVRNTFNILLAAFAFLALAPLAHAQGTSLAAAQNQYWIPEGTEFKLALHTAVSSKTSKKGDRVITTLLDPVYVDDRLVLNKGVRIDGHVQEVKSAHHRGKGGRLYVLFDTLDLPNGQKVAITGSLTEVFSSREGGNGSTVDSEGDLKGGGPNRKEQMVLFGAPAAAGAVAGGIGPGIAAGVGGLVAAFILPKGKQAVLPAGSLIGMRLDRDLNLTLPPGKDNAQASK